MAKTVKTTMSVDEALETRKDFVRSGNTMMKAFKAPPSWNGDARTAKFVMSTETPDRMSDIVIQSGMDTTDFENNPQALLFHSSRSFPVGKWSDITKVLGGRPRRTEGTLNFLPEGADAEVDRAVAHVSFGTLRTVSIGFIPHQVEMIRDDDDNWTGGFKFTESELIECSLVPVPANADCLVKDLGGDFKMAREIIEDVLDNWAKHPETGLVIPRETLEAELKKIDGDKTTHLVMTVKNADEFQTHIRDAVLAALGESMEKVGEFFEVTSEDKTEEKSADTFSIETIEDPAADPDPAEVKGAEVDEQVIPAGDKALGADEDVDSRSVSMSYMDSKSGMITLSHVSFVDDEDKNADAEESKASLSLFERMSAGFAKMFGGTTETKDDEKVEPVLEVPAIEPKIADAAAKEAALARAKALSERLNVEVTA